MKTETIKKQRTKDYSELALKKVIEAVEIALEKYSSANVDVIRNEENNMLDVVYHSRHNSFCIKPNVAEFDSVQTKELEILLDELGVGYVW